jgi:hypothetical protein
MNQIELITEGMRVEKKAALERLKQAEDQAKQAEDALKRVEADEKALALVATLTQRYVKEPPKLLKPSAEPPADKQVYKYDRTFHGYDYALKIETIVLVVLGCECIDRVKFLVSARGIGAESMRVDRYAVRARIRTAIRWINWLLSVLATAPAAFRVINRFVGTNDYNFTAFGMEALRTKDFYRLFRIAAAHRALYGDGEKPDDFLDVADCPNIKLVTDTARVHGEQLAVRQAALNRAMEIMAKPLESEKAAQGAASALAVFAAQLVNPPQCPVIES